ncbi:NBS-LRR type resistance protein [Cucumis melo var. makuwa]|uniref:NBS-LRR type resistance protein n=1 Tax=Cucumis melo var. makuwa TaxID=1194695 RepID=A0A5A7T2X5_CUCMM|nr:NBS-LRR type resistance protein [Cucumis melo var. makuwa]
MPFWGFPDAATLRREIPFLIKYRTETEREKERKKERKRLSKPRGDRIVSVAPVSGPSATLVMVGCCVEYFYCSFEMAMLQLCYGSLCSLEGFVGCEDFEALERSCRRPSRMRTIKCWNSNPSLPQRVVSHSLRIEGIPDAARCVDIRCIRKEVFLTAPLSTRILASEEAFPTPYQHSVGKTSSDVFLPTFFPTS